MTDSDLRWYVRSRGRVLGPFGFGQLVTLRNQGRVAKFDEVSRDRRIWVRADSMPELYPPMESADSVVKSNSLAESADLIFTVEEEDERVPGHVPDEVSSWYYMGSLGQTGPIRLTELVRLAQSGAVGPETLVWTSSLGNWMPARTVAALGLAVADEKSVADRAKGGDDPPKIAPRGIGLAVASFVLGLLGLLTGAMFFVVSAVAVNARDNQKALGLIFLSMMGIWGVNSLLAVIFGALGMARANRDEGRRRGFGLAITGLILGIIGLLALVALLFIAALGVIVVGGIGQG